MVCQKCGVKNATVHFTNIINGNITEFHLCETCARDKDSIVQVGIEELMSGFFGIKPQGGKQKLECSFCGATQNDVSKFGKAGCEHCYEVFGEYIIPIVRKVHGTDTHIGKKPEYDPENNPKRIKKKETAEVPENAVNTDTDELKSLEDEMKKAVAEEEYEKAAVFRDRIRKLKEKGKSEK